mmetsp:Transcript_5987/g.13304  ORF Transcript_5987/g.13304 Transcript_5987/m.13304 type:complete len:88 (+) Transcript_5987:107-370(+)
MPISEKAQRAWKAGTAVLTAFTSFYCLFYIDYGPQEHVFSDLQRWYRNKMDNMLGIDLNKAKQIASQQQEGIARRTGGDDQEGDGRR